MDEKIPKSRLPPPPVATNSACLALINELVASPLCSMDIKLGRQLVKWDKLIQFTYSGLVLHTLQVACGWP